MLADHPDRFYAVTTGKSTLKDWADLSKDQETITVVDTMSMVILNTIKNDNYSERLRDYYLCEGYYYLNIRKNEEATDAFIKTLYLHPHCFFEPREELKDELHRCLAIATSEVSISKTNVLYKQTDNDKSIAEYKTALTYHREAFYTWSHIREKNCA